MNGTLDDFMALKKQVEDANRKADQAAGALEEARKQLSKFGVSTIKEAEAKLENLKNECQKVKKEFETELETYEKKWGNTNDNNGRNSELD